MCDSLFTPVTNELNKYHMKIMWDTCPECLSDSDNPGERWCIVLCTGSAMFTENICAYHAVAVEL